MFRNIYMIQNENACNNDFLELLKKGTAIPEKIIKENFIDDQTVLNEHYFNNFYNNILNDDFKSKKFFIESLENQETIDILFEKFNISIFKYKLID